jgi:protein SCO1/2
MKTRSKYLPLLVLAIIIGMAVLYVLLTLPSKQKVVINSNLAPSTNKQYMLDFKLTDQNGAEFDGASLKGKPTLVYFGFTFCPDICPTALGKVANVMEVMRKYGIDLNAVFVTIDPERDTTQDLAKYVTYFDKNIIALGGSQEDIKKAASIFNVYYAKAEDSSDAKNYMINHSSFVYVLDKDGMMVKLFSFQDEPSAIIDFLRLNFRK